MKWLVVFFLGGLTLVAAVIAAEVMPGTQNGLQLLGICGFFTALFGLEGLSDE